MGRHRSLLNLLQRAAADQELSTVPGGEKGASPRFLKESVRPLPILSFAGGQLQGLDENGELLFSVPLLMADLVYLSASSRSEAVQKGEVHEYFLALAPRPQSLTEHSKLEDVWIMYTQPAEFLGKNWRDGWMTVVMSSKLSRISI